MDTYTYHCHYCAKSYTPKRRGKQKYCSASCRTRAWQTQQKQAAHLPAHTEKAASLQDKKITLEGIGQAAMGAAANDLVQKGLAKLLGVQSDELLAIKRLEQRMKRLEEMILAIPNLDVSRLTAPGPHWQPTGQQFFAQANGQTIALTQYRHPSDGRIRYQSADGTWWEYQVFSNSYRPVRE